MSATRLKKEFQQGLSGINDDVEKALREKQKKKQYKDAGERVFSSRKAEALYDKFITTNDLQKIEQDEGTAIELVKKDKVFPKIIPLEEKQIGVSPGTAFLKTKIRQAFPAKPYKNTKEAREEYVRFSNLVFKQISNTEESTPLFNLLTYVEKNGISRREIKGRFGARFYNLLMALNGSTYSVSDSLKKILEEANKYDGITSERASRRKETFDTNYLRRLERYTNAIEKAEGIKTNDDIIEYRKKHILFSGGELRQNKTVEEFKEYVITVSKRYKTQFEETYHKRVSQFPYVETAPDWSWTKPKAKKESSATDKKPKIVPVPLSHIKRTGGLLIDTADEHTVINKLLFKSLTLGNYVKDNEAKEHIKHFISAITDLCEIIDIDLGINSNLGIGFGAFGRGGKAMATYHTTKRIINLTKKAGDGSVAHEWGHFFDHYLGINNFSFLTKDIQTLFNETIPNYNRYYKGARYNIPEGLFKSKLREHIDSGNSKVEKAMGALLAMLKHAYYYYEDNAVSFTTATLEEGKPKKRTDSILLHYSSLQGTYWKDIVELFARSWECYIYDKLKEQGRANNYLVSGSNFYIPVYPQNKERKYINKCFDKLLEVVKEEKGLKSFVPFTTMRTDEYIDLTNEGKENKGVVIAKKTIAKSLDNKSENKKLKLLKLRAKAIIIKQKQSA